MNFDEILAIVQNALPAEKFGTIESFILRQSWLGQTYSDMAKESGYASEYIKEVGSRLWQELSEAIGTRVTKKNLQLVFSEANQVRLSQFIKLESQKAPLPNAIDLLEKEPSPPIAPQTISFPSGSLAVSSPFYIERPPIETLAASEIAQPACVIRLKAPKQMGKSSLLNRILAHSRSLGYHTVYLDFQDADSATFSSIDRLLRWFCANVSWQLKFTPQLEAYWDEEMGSKVSCKIYFTRYLLEQLDRPLVIALNELNQVFEHPEIAQDFLPMLRAWHELAKQNATWQKLRLVLVHSTEVYVPLNLNQSPFNVGLSLKLPPFTLEQLQALALRYGLSWAVDDTGCDRLLPLYAMIGGHPYLANLTFYHLCHCDLSLEELLEYATHPTGIYGHHLRGHLATLHSDSHLAEKMQQVVNSNEAVQLDALTAYKLESMGLIQLEANWAKPRCELYRRYFSEQRF
jgi:hypothetical protein